MEVHIFSPLPRKWLSYSREERVAVLIGSVDGSVYTVRRAVAVPNRAARRHNRYAVTNSDVRLLIGSAASDIIGFVHSHIDGDVVPSSIDLDLMPEGLIGAVWANGQLGGWYEKGRLLHPRVLHREVEQATSLIA